ncbi:MAG: glycoside hydrolase family 57 protein [Verrucomicrobiota bacterium]|nr:glycoside hydrolase family 57 protein [Verrucomicrobiota bacterium]
MANVVFLWHMHQPYYVDPTTQTALMPWVRLHCLKGYLDMISIVEEFPHLRMNFNLTPVLVLQIRELIEGKVRDQWLDWARRPAAELDEAGQFALLENFFKVHWDTLIKPFPRYWELLNKRGLTFYENEVRRGLRYFTTQEFRDLQTWFNLAWCGYTAERLFPELAELKRKGRDFTEEEKSRVLDLHLEIMRLVLPKYRAAEERGQVELTTTAYFHPILPLVYDSQFAERSLPGRQFPKRFHWPEDAAAQLTLAVEQHAATFGQPPRGLWPSEGSIAPEMIPLMERTGIEYFCSDEENLFNSLRLDPGYQGGEVDHLELFQGWRVTHDGAAVNAVFREKPLSDFIGFLAARKDPEQAASHMLGHLKHIAELVDAKAGVIPLILDGENAWSSFPDGGEGFLRALYGGIQAAGEGLRSCTIEEFFQRNPPRKHLTTLHTGSWISSNFDIWIGDPEENRAWDLLGEAREFLQRQIDSGALTPEQECAALREIYVAEGSDWFWWYGPDFSTENDKLFDHLFRIHLKNVYRFCGATPPAVLDRPIADGRTREPYELPNRPVSPAIDGRRGSFYKWCGAGRYLASENGASRPAQSVRQILFGHDAERLFVRVEWKAWAPGTWVVEFHEPAGVRLSVDVRKRGGAREITLSFPDGRATRHQTVAAGECLELGVPLSELGLAGGARVAFQLKRVREGMERECYPETVSLEFALLGEEWALQNWSV